MSWRASLLVSIAGVLRDAGAFARAMETADAAWELTKDATDQHGRAVADLAIAEWLTIASMFGQAEPLKTRVESLGGRNIRGPAGVRVNRARETIGMVVSHPENIIASGPEAVRVLWTLRGRKPAAVGPGFSPTELDAVAEGNSNDPALPVALRSFVPTAAGTSLAQVAELAKQSGLRMQIVKRVDAREVPVPAIVHWRLGHFSAVVAREGDRYHIVDVALGGSRWLPRDTLLDESSGYWLLPAGSDQGWTVVSATDAAALIGHSCPPNAPPPRPPKCPKCPKPGQGMPVYTLDELTASLVIADQPTTYTAPRGPDVTFRLSYNHRDITQPQIFTYANLGPMWGFPWARFLQEEPMVCAQGCDPAHVWVQMGTGAAEVYSSPNAQGEYPAHWSSKAVLVRTSTNPLRYERRLADGGVEVYGQADAAPVGQQRVFLTQIIDPQGLSVTLTWDAQFRPVALTDAIGQVSTFAYEHPTDPLKVTRYTDPYGRSVTLTRQKNGAGYDALESRTFDGHHRPLSVTDASGQVTTLTYNVAGQVLTVTNARSETTTLTYDAAGRVLTVTGPLTGATTTYAYDSVGRLRTATDPGGYTMTTDVDRYFGGLSNGPFK